MALERLQHWKNQKELQSLKTQLQTLHFFSPGMPYQKDRLLNKTFLLIKNSFIKIFTQNIEQKWMISRIKWIFSLENVLSCRSNRYFHCEIVHFYFQIDIFIENVLLFLANKHSKIYVSMIQVYLFELNFIDIWFIWSFFI